MRDEASEKFLTAKQLAELLQISEATVRRLARAGILPSLRITPRLVRFYLPEVFAALDSRQSERPRRRRGADGQLSLVDLLEENSR